MSHPNLHSKLALLPLVALLLGAPAAAELWQFDASFSLRGLGDPAPILASFGTLRVEFLPEPGAFAGLLAGASMLAALGWRRRL